MRVELSINGQRVQAETGETILTAAQRLGVEIPTLCHHPELRPYGSCFLCVVQVAGRANLQPACATPVADGMEVCTENADIAGARRMCLELLFSDHVGDCYGPCLSACPCRIDIPGFIKALQEGEVATAIGIIKAQLAQPASLGRVCPRPCESACRRALIDAPLAICTLKRHAADQAQDGGVDTVPAQAPASGKRVAVIGAGPAGVAVAYFLAQHGHAVEVFDRHAHGGGMLRYGIPAFRLPRDVIERELAVLTALGVRFHFGRVLGADLHLSELRQRYDAVFVGVGAQGATAMQIPGEEAPGVRSGVAFLAEVSENQNLRVGRRVMVVGGGNTAIDAARTALRCGAEEVTILYRRTRAEMPAYLPEIDAAEREGVKLSLLAAPVAITPLGEGALAVQCIQMTLGEPDASGRRRPVPLAGSETVIEVDEVIAAIGQRIDDTGLAETGLTFTRWGTVVVDPETMQTALPGVFAAGDCVSGADIAVRAAAGGHLAALAMDAALRSEPISHLARAYAHSLAAMPEVAAEVLAGYDERARVHQEELAPQLAVTSFAEVEKGYSLAKAQEEAARCLSCGCRAVDDCAIRAYANRYNIDPSRFRGASRAYEVDDSHPHVRYEAHKCITCASCVRICDEVLQVPALGLEGRGFATRVRAPLQRRLLDTLPLEGWEPVVAVCPTGALTAKAAPVRSRPLRPEPAVD